MFQLWHLFPQLRPQGEDRSLHRRDEALARQVRLRGPTSGRTSRGSHPGTPQAMVAHLPLRRQAKTGGARKFNRKSIPLHLPCCFLLTFLWLDLL